MKKHIISILSIAVFLLIAIFAEAQSRYFDERYVYTQHFVNPVLVNPGATGAMGYQQVLFNYRNKWASFPGSPKTITFAYNGPVGNRLGFGAQLMRDTYGALETSKGQLGFSYTIESPNNKVGFGLTTEYVQHRISGGDFNNTLLDPTDEIILQRLDGNQFFDASFGIYGVYDKKLTYGLSLPSLISNRLNDDGLASPDRSLGYILHFGYEFQATENDIQIEPSIFIKSLMNVPTHLDANVKVTFLDGKFTGGVSYTLGGDKRLGFLLGARLDSMYLYYSYNVSSHEFQETNNGSHEITVRFNIGEFGDSSEE